MKRYMKGNMNKNVSLNFYISVLSLALYLSASPHSRAQLLGMDNGIEESVADDFRAEVDVLINGNNLTLNADAGNGKLLFSADTKYYDDETRSRIQFISHGGDSTVWIWGTQDGGNWAHEMTLEPWRNQLILGNPSYPGMVLKHSRSAPTIQMGSVNLNNYEQTAFELSGGSSSGRFRFAGVLDTTYWEWTSTYYQMDLSASNILTLYNPDVSANDAKIIMTPSNAGSSITVDGNEVITTGTANLPTFGSASGTGSVALGYITPLSEDGSNNITSSATNSGSVALAGGRSTGLGSFAFGRGQDYDDGWFSYPSIAAGQYSVAFSGGRTSSGADYSFAMGAEAQASGDYSISFGRHSKADSNDSLAFGRSARAYGMNSIAIGHSSQTGFLAPADFAIAIGYASDAPGSNAVAIGSYSQATGASAYALGGIASGTNSFASGKNSLAQNHWSAAYGASAQATAYAATALGNNATAQGWGSTAIGNTISEAAWQTTLGAFNTITGVNPSDNLSTDPLFVVGNGTGASSSDRSNALQLRRDGVLETHIVRTSAGGDLSMGTFTAGTDPRQNIDPNQVYWTPNP